MQKKRKEIEVSVPARIKGSGLVARTSWLLQKSVGDVWSRISSASALQKERSASSERRPSSERRSAGETVVTRLERRYVASRAHRCEAGEDRRKAQGGERSSSNGSPIAKKRCVGRGTGAVKATGSCEESLPTEGTSDHQAASAFTGRRWRWSWRTPHHSTRANPSKRTHGQDCSSCEGKRGEG